MSRFHGQQGKGALRKYRQTKRADAEQRALLTRHEDTRIHRLGKCDCTDKS
jgi:hypothetical protein